MLKQKSIKLGFSVRFQLWYCFVVSVVFICASTLLYWMMNKALSGSYLENLRTLYFLDQNLPLYLSIMALLQTCFILILTLVITVLVSHRIAGPVFRYEAVLSKIASGVYPPRFNTRETDQLKSIVDPLNELSNTCRGVYEEVHVLTRALDTDKGGQDFFKEDNLNFVRGEISAIRLRMGKKDSERVFD